MDNKPQNGPGPGMYQASDGNWYPQSQMPTGAPPPPMGGQGGESNSFYGNQPPMQHQASYGQQQPPFGQQQPYGQQQPQYPAGQTVYVDDRDKDKGGGIGCCGAFFAGIAACCCLDMLC